MKRGPKPKIDNESIMDILYGKKDKKTGKRKGCHDPAVYKHLLPLLGTNKQDATGKMVFVKNEKISISEVQSVISRLPE